jgi:hypothetical protein
VRILGAVVLPLVLLVPAASEAQRKKQEYTKGPTGKATGACGARILPLIEGNKWTYGFVQAPVQQREDLAKLLPSQPMEIIITVQKVENRGTETVVTLEEKSKADLSKDPKKHIYDERTVQSTITCTPTKFDISPNSFFFSGEPGGYYGITLDKIDRPAGKDSTWKLVNGSVGEQQWREDIVAHFTRSPVEGSTAKFDSGKIELERRFIPAQPEPINTKVGVYTAEKIAISTTGRVTLDHPQPETKPMDLPENWVNQLWLVNNVGVVQVLNSYAHMYQLTDVALK